MCTLLLRRRCPIVFPRSRSWNKHSLSASDLPNLPLQRTGLRPAGERLYRWADMGISESVERLASSLAAHVRRLPQKDPVLMILLAEIATMPMWRDLGTLDQWEQRVKMADINRDIRERAGDPFLKLADEIFEVGEYNLYGAI